MLSLRVSSYMLLRVVFVVVSYSSRDQNLFYLMFHIFVHCHAGTKGGCQSCRCCCSERPTGTGWFASLNVLIFCRAAFALISVFNGCSLPLEPYIYFSMISF